MRGIVVGWEDRLGGGPIRNYGPHQLLVACVADRWSGERPHEALCGSPDSARARSERAVWQVSETSRRAKRFLLDTPDIRA